MIDSFEDRLVIVHHRHRRGRPGTGLRSADSPAVPPDRARRPARRRPAGIAPGPPAVRPSCFKAARIFWAVFGPTLSICRRIRFQERLSQGIDQDPEEGEHILDMGRFGQLQAAPFFKGDVPVGQFQFQLVGVEAGTEQHGDLPAAIPCRSSRGWSRPHSGPRPPSLRGTINHRPCAAVDPGEQCLGVFLPALAMMALVSARMGWVER